MRIIEGEVSDAQYVDVTDTQLEIAIRLIGLNKFAIVDQDLLLEPIYVLISGNDVKITLNIEDKDLLVEITKLIVECSFDRSNYMPYSPYIMYYDKNDFLKYGSTV